MFKNIEKFNSPIDDYNEILCKGVCGIEKIIWWLIKHEQTYEAVKYSQRERDTLKSLTSNLTETDEFEKLYGKMKYLSILHENETYFKEQLKAHDESKDSVSKLKEWFEYQYANKSEQQLFSYVFYDNREKTNFSLKIRELELNRNDFKYTLRFMAIIEKSMMIKLVGTVKTIKDLEVFKEKKTKTKGSGISLVHAYTKQELILSVNDENLSENLIIFKDAKTEYLKAITIGDYVKIYARLLGGVWINSDGVDGNYNSLIGWSIKKTEQKEKILYDDEFELYYRYFC